MRNRIAAASISLILTVLAVGCGQDASKTDLKEPKLHGKAIPKDYRLQAPDKLTVYLNIDAHPTIAQVCIDGVAFATTSRDFSALTRIPEWDDECKKANK